MDTGQYEQQYMLICLLLVIDNLLGINIKNADVEKYPEKEGQPMQPRRSMRMIKWTETIICNTDWATIPIITTYLPPPVV